MDIKRDVSELNHLGKFLNESIDAYRRHWGDPYQRLTWLANNLQKLDEQDKNQSLASDLKALIDYLDQIEASLSNPLEAATFQKLAVVDSIRGTLIHLLDDLNPGYLANRKRIISQGRRQALRNNIGIIFWRVSKYVIFLVGLLTVLRWSWKALL